MNRFVDLYFTALKVIVAICLMIMVILVFGNVVLRYGFSSGITIAEEMSRWAFVWLTFIGGAVALRENTHLGMDTVVSRLPLWGKKLCFVLSHLIMLVCVLTFLIGSWRQTRININIGAPATDFSMAWFYGVGGFFAIMAILILGYNLYALISGRLGDNKLIQVKESEDDLDEEKLAEYQQKMKHGLENGANEITGEKP